MSKWEIRYDIMRRMPGERPTYISCCYYGDDTGFATIEEANEVLKQMKQACGELDNHQTFDIWPIAVHPDFSSINMQLGGDDDDGEDDGDITNGSN